MRQIKVITIAKEKYVKLNDIIEFLENSKNNNIIKTLQNCFDSEPIKEANKTQLNIFDYIPEVSRK